MLDQIAKVASPKEITTSNIGTSDSIIVAIPKPKPGFLGLIYDETTALLVDYRSAMSFRIRICNMGLHKHLKMFRCELQFSKEILERYFTENEDNPYALEYVIGRMARIQDVTTELTQVPPVFKQYQNQTERESAVTNLAASAQPLDLVFSRPLQGSNVSSLIRSIDRCQFSHVGTYVGDNITVDAGPSGVTRNHLTEICHTSHVGLYRLRNPFVGEQKEKALQRAENLVGGGYNWRGLFEIYLRNRLKLPPNPMRPSVSQLLFSDSFQLIDYV